MCSVGSSCLPASAQANSTSAGTTNGAGGANLVNYLAGDRSNESSGSGGAYYRKRLHVLGDVVDAQPVYVAAPVFNYTDSGYGAFQNTNNARQSMVYVGANDGMLHAVNGSTGAEVWSYIPSMILPNLYKLADLNYSANHAFSVDGTPQSSDVCFANCASSTSADWHTILVGGLGAGGSGYYALDVTSASSPTLLWEFKYGATQTSATNGFTTDPDLGLSFGTPVITKLSDGTWVVIVTSGYNNNVSSGSGHGIVWVLNARTGAIIKKIDTGVGSIVSPSGLSQIAAYAYSAPTNNTALRLYGGDLLGNLWRFDISGLNASGGTVTPQLLATLKDSAGTAQPITATPVLGNSGSNIMVYVGTGQLLGLSDIVTTQAQSIYAIKDTLANTSAPGTVGVYGSPRSTSCASSTSANCFVQVTMSDLNGVRTATSSVSVKLATMNGWFEDLPESGERINTNMDLQQGALVFTSNIPGSSSACSVGGSSYLNYVNYATGLAIPSASDVGLLLTSGTTTALANAASIVRLPSGKVIAIVNLSDGTTVTKSIPIPPPASGTRRISWRELVTN
jgi:type IV pilus assembly protein PilY1